MFDANVTIGDESLQQMLAKGADSQMKSIVSTIQKEQNAIIRNDFSRSLIVQGRLAVGRPPRPCNVWRICYTKTAIRLRQTRSYFSRPIKCSTVMYPLSFPSSARRTSRRRLFQEYLEYWLGSSFHVEDPFNQIEYVLTAQSTPTYEARLQGMKYKASEAFMRALQNYAKWLGREGMLFKGIRFRDRVLITSEQMRTQFYSYDPSLSLANRVDLLQKWLLKELSLLERKERRASWVEEEVQYLDNEQYADVFSECIRIGKCLISPSVMPLFTRK